MSKLKIKLNEVSTQLKNINGEKNIKDKHIISVLRTYDLNEINDAIKQVIKINGIVVLTNYHTVVSGGKNESNTPSTYRLVIPPYSQVVTEGTTNSAADIPFYHIITGKLYK